MNHVEELKKHLTNNGENISSPSLEELYEILEHKTMKKIFLECYVDDKYDKEYLKECFKILVPFFYQDFISCNSFPEELAEIYIQNCTTEMLRKQYNRGIIFAMITNPNVNFKRQIVEMYIDKLTVKEKFDFRINQKDLSFLQKYSVNKNYKYWDVVFDQICQK